MSSDFKPSQNAMSLETLVASRICHDLAGPISAISNGIELLQLTGGDVTRGPEIDLVTDSIQSLTERLRLCRLAFGSATLDQSINISEIQSILGPLYQSRVTIAWDTNGSEISRKMGKSLMLAVLCAETAVPLGGQITISGQDREWSVQAAGDKVSPPEVWKMLDEDSMDDELPSSQCQFLILPQTIAEGDGVLRTKITDTSAAIHISM